MFVFYIWFFYWGLESVLVNSSIQSETVVPFLCFLCGEQVVSTSAGEILPHLISWYPFQNQRSTDAAASFWLLVLFLSFIHPDFCQYCVPFCLKVPVAGEGFAVLHSPASSLAGVSVVLSQSSLENSS